MAQSRQCLLLDLCHPLVCNAFFVGYLWQRVLFADELTKPPTHRDDAALALGQTVECEPKSF